MYMKALETTNSMRFLTLVLLWENCFFSPLVSLGIAFNAFEFSQICADLSYQWQFLSAWKIMFFLIVSKVFCSAFCFELLPKSLGG